MARNNEKGGAKKAGARKAAGSRKAAGAGKEAGSRKAAGARKTSGRKSTGARKTGSARKNAGRKSEAPEMARASRAGGTKKRAPGRTRSTATRRAPGRTGAARTTSRRRTTAARRGRSTAQYSASEQRALWIESPDQHAERPGQTLATRDHDVIRQWAEDRGAVPATIAGTEHDGRPGVLRFDFPNFTRSGGRLRHVDWDEWFETFDQRKLVFLFQEQMKRGNQSNFFRLDSPDREEA